MNHELAVNHNLVKSPGRTSVAGLRYLDKPAWRWS